MGQGRGQSGNGVRGGSRSGRTTTRGLVAVGAYVAQDLRDSEGVMRPLLRRAALRLVSSGRQPVRQLGSAYLRLDPPGPAELPRGPDVIGATRLPPSPRAQLSAPDRAEVALKNDALAD